MRHFVDQEMQTRHLQGAALLDEQGRETPITEAMVEQALIRLMAEELVQRTRNRGQHPADMPSGI